MQLICVLVIALMLAGAATTTGGNHLSRKAAEKKASEAAKIAKIQYEKVYSVFVISQNWNSNSFWEIIFLDKDGKMMGKAEIDAACSEPDIIDQQSFFQGGGILDTTYYNAQNVRELFKGSHKDTLVQANLVLAGDIDVMNIPQPIWQVVDSNGKQWYITTKGVVYDADKLRKQYIDDQEALRRNKP